MGALLAQEVTEGDGDPAPLSTLVLIVERVDGCHAGEVEGSGLSGVGGGVHAEVSTCPKPTQDSGSHYATPLASLAGSKMLPACCFP